MLTFVLYATGDQHSLALAVDGIVDAVALISDMDQNCEVILIDGTSDTEVHRLLQDAQGFSLVVSQTGQSADSWRQALAAAAGEFVWFGDDKTILDAEQLRDSLVRLKGEANLDFVAPSDFLPSFLLARKDAVQFGELDETIDAGSFVDELHKLMLASVKPKLSNYNVGLSHAQVELTSPDSLEIGKFSYAGAGSLIKSWISGARILIGDYCSISGDVRLLHAGPPNRKYFTHEGDSVTFLGRGEHRLECATTFPIGMLVDNVHFDEFPDDGSVLCDPLTIGNDVWIGYGAMVVGPLTIGDGAIVSAGSVVLQDVPPYAVVAGNPAKVVRMRFSADVVERLQRVRWWEWPESRVVENWWWFTRPIGEFLDHFDPTAG